MTVKPIDEKEKDLKTLANKKAEHFSKAMDGDDHKSKRHAQAYDAAKKLHSKKKWEDEEIDDEDKDEIDETAAADTLKTHPSASKSALLAMTVASLASKSHEDLTKWYYDSIETSKKSADGAPDASAKNKSSIEMKPSGTGANSMAPFPFVPVTKEDVADLFDGQELSEDLLEKASTLFEAAVNARLVLEVTRIEEETEEKTIAAIDAIRTELTEKVDSYLDYAAQEWLTENEVAIENSIMIEHVQEFQEKLKALFTESYIDIPQDRINVLATMSEKIEEIEGKLNAQIEETLEIKKERDALVADKTFREVSEGMTLTEQEKFRTLTETVGFDGDIDDLTRKLTIVKEANFKSAPKRDVKSGIIAEESVTLTGDVDVEDASPKKRNPLVSNYVDAISRTKGLR